MSKKRLIVTSTISIFLVAILMIGSTYSIFTTQDTDEELNVYKTGVLDITYTLSSSNVQITNSIPTSVEDSITIDPYRITVTNHGSVSYMFDVVLENTTATDQIDEQYIMTQVGKIDPKLLSVCTNHVIKEDVIIPAGGSVDIDIRVWISDTIQNTEIGKSFFAKLKIDGLAIYDDNTEIDNSILIANRSLYSTVKMGAILDNTSSEFVSSSSGINFSSLSSHTNGKGLYLRAGTENDTYPIYYYRGAVTNNNVLFANFCWKIVRTTETGGTKLIYNGTQKDELDTVPIEQSEYVHLSNDTTYPYDYDVDTHQWTSTNKDKSTTSTISFQVNTSGTYVLSYSVASEETWDETYIFKDGILIGRYSGTLHGNILLEGLTPSNVIIVQYVQSSSYSKGEEFVSFSLGKPTGTITKTCNNTGEDTQIGTSKFHSDGKALTDVGYMFGTRYEYQFRELNYLRSIYSYSSISASSNYYYGTDITYSDGTYTLNSAEAHTWSSDYESLSGYYTCRSTSTSCRTVSYIVATDSSRMYTLDMSNGKFLNDVNTSFVLGSSVIDNGDGTYTLSNTTTIQKSDWYSNYNNYLNYYTCFSTNTTCRSMNYITSIDKYRFYYCNMANQYVYGNTVSYSDGTYTLSNTKSFWNWYENYNTLNSNHYTCFSTETTCSTVYYIFHNNRQQAVYISLTDGKILDNVLNEMIGESSNLHDSAIKTMIDDWYQGNLVTYSSYLEDTVWCSDRSVSSFGGWDSNEGNPNSYLYFSPYNRAFTTYQINLGCSNVNNSFTVDTENGNGKLTYPIALLTLDEVRLAGGYRQSSNGSFYLRSLSDWWTLSPGDVQFDGRVFTVWSSGTLNPGSLTEQIGVRPSISLRYGVEVFGGDGTLTNPYIIS